MKTLLKKGNEPYLVPLAYKSTPLSNGYSPAELQMNRKLRMDVPSSREARKSLVPDRKLLVEREEELKQTKQLLIVVTGFEICRQCFLEIWYG